MFSKKILINAALVLCSILFSLFIAEVFLRSVKPYFLTARFLLPPNLDVKFKTLEFDTQVKTNSIGIRGEREYSIKHNGKFRIAVIGDSFTFGWGVNNDETFPAKLENHFRKSNHSNVEVINFGRPGENLEGYLRAFNLHAKRLQPQIVIVALTPTNDCTLSFPAGYIAGASHIKRFATKVTERGLRPWEKVTSYLGRLITTRVTKPLRLKLRAALIEPFEATAAIRDPIDGSDNPLTPNKLEKMLSSNPEARARYHRLNKAGWVAKGLGWDVAPWLVLSAIFEPRFTKNVLLLDPKTRPAFEFQWKICAQVIKNFQAIVEKAGSRFILVLLATPAQTSPEFLANRKALGIDIPQLALTDSHVNDGLMVFCKREGVQCIDTLEPARNAAQHNPQLFFPIDGHPARSAHSLFASIIARELRPFLPDR